MLLTVPLPIINWQNGDLASKGELPQERRWREEEKREGDLD